MKGHQKIRLALLSCLVLEAGVNPTWASNVPAIPNGFLEKSVQFMGGEEALSGLDNIVFDYMETRATAQGDATTRGRQSFKFKKGRLVEGRIEAQTPDGAVLTVLKNDKIDHRVNGGAVTDPAALRRVRQDLDREVFWLLIPHNIRAAKLSTQHTGLDYFDGLLCRVIDVDIKPWRSTLGLETLSLYLDPRSYVVRGASFKPADGAPATLVYKDYDITNDLIVASARNLLKADKKSVVATTAIFNLSMNSARYNLVMAGRYPAFTVKDKFKTITLPPEKSAPARASTAASPQMEEAERIFASIKASMPAPEPSAAPQVQLASPAIADPSALTVASIKASLDAKPRRKEPVIVPSPVKPETPQKEVNPVPEPYKFEESRIRTASLPAPAVAASAPSALDTSVAAAKAPTPMTVVPSFRTPAVSGGKMMVAAALPAAAPVVFSAPLPAVQPIQPSAAQIQAAPAPTPAPTMDSAPRRANRSRVSALAAASAAAVPRARRNTFVPADEINKALDQQARASSNNAPRARRNRSVYAETGRAPRAVHNSAPHARRTRADFYANGIDMVDDGAQVHVVVDMPGVRQDDINLSVSDQILTVRGTRSRRNTDGQGQQVIEQRLDLPYAVSMDQMQSRLEQGVLYVTLPRLVRRASRVAGVLP